MKAYPHDVASIRAEDFDPKIHEIARPHTAATAEVRDRGPGFNEAISQAPPTAEELKAAANEEKE